MWPWGHLAVAYLLYSAIVHCRFDQPPRALPVFALAIGSQFPDLIDKPLAWSLSVLPGGRTLMHSLFVAVPLGLAVYAATERLEYPNVGLAFVVGYLSHLLADVPPSAIPNDPAAASYFLWPLVDHPPEDAVSGILDAFLHYYEMGLYEWFQFGLLALAIGVWFLDGRPGLGAVRTELERRLRIGS